MQRSSTNMTGRGEGVAAGAAGGASSGGAEGVRPCLLFSFLSSSFVYCIHACDLVVVVPRSFVPHHRGRAPGSNVVVLPIIMERVQPDENSKNCDFERLESSFKNF
jgi:hypothetical protein